MLALNFNGKSSKDFNLIISDWRRPLFAEILDEYMTIEGLHGKRHVPKKLGIKEIEVQFKRINEDVFDWVTTAEDISSWLHTTDELELRFDDEPNRYYIGKVSSAPNPEHIRVVSEFWVTFTCHPFKYGEERTETITTSGEVISHGTAESPCLLTLTMSQGANKLSVSINDVTIMYDGEVKTGDVLTIDSNEFELRVNGELKVLEVSGYFSELAKGTNTIDCDVEAEIAVEWQELYL